MVKHQLVRIESSLLFSYPYLNVQGKSWTMEGPDHYDPDLKGVIPRSIERLFNAISNAAATIRFTVQLSYYEIYCERVRDLLNPLLDNLKLRETKEEGFIIPEITEIFCVDEETVFQTLAIGKSNRASAPTLMNAESSRSHSILSLILGQTDEVSGRSKRSRLFLVDLAGSEKVHII
jgi:kinesin family protein 5